MPLDTPEIPASLSVNGDSKFVLQNYWDLYNKLSQIQWLKHPKFIIYSSGDLKSKMGCRAALFL